MTSGLGKGTGEEDDEEEEDDDPDGGVPLFALNQRPPSNGSHQSGHHIAKGAAEGVPVAILAEPEI